MRTSPPYRRCRPQRVKRICEFVLEPLFEATCKRRAVEEVPNRVPATSRSGQILSVRRHFFVRPFLDQPDRATKGVFTKKSLKRRGLRRISTVVATLNWINFARSAKLIELMMPSALPEAQPAPRVHSSMEIWLKRRETPKSALLGSLPDKISRIYAGRGSGTHF